MNSEIKKLFKVNGNLKGKSFDPYRELNTDSRCKLLFDEDGDLLYNAESDIKEFINDHLQTIHWFSDAVALIHASEFSKNTKGNYSTIYYWR